MALPRRPGFRSNNSPLGQGATPIELARLRARLAGYTVKAILHSSTDLPAAALITRFIG
jgi:hypothetical protein